MAKSWALPASLTRDTGLPFDVLQAMRWDDLYQLLEDTTDKGENVATVLSNIALKNA